VKLNEIIAGALYVRGKPNKLARDVKLAALKRAGVNTVVCLVGGADPDLRYASEVEYVYAPLSDSHRVSKSRLRYLRDLIVERIRQGRGVMVHCQAGRCRSGLVASLVVAELKGISTKAALEYVRSRRPGAVANSYFERCLEEGTCL